MKKTDYEKNNFIFLSAIICIIMGMVSLVYSLIIPTTAFPYNAPVSLVFIVIGIAFIVVGVILMIFRKRASRAQKNG